MRRLLFIILPAIIISGKSSVSSVSNFLFIFNNSVQQTQRINLAQKNSETNVGTGLEKIIIEGLLSDEEDIVSDEDSNINTTPRISLLGNKLPVEKFNHYRNILSPVGQETYDQIYDGAINGKTSIHISTGVNYTEIEDIVYGLIYDSPELFWLEGRFTYNWNSNQQVTSVHLTPNDLFNNLEINKQKFEQTARSVLQNAVGLKGDYEKAKYIHDYLVQNIDYNDNGYYTQTAYSGIVLNQTVCAGYAKAFQYYMMNLGIPSSYIVGMTTQGYHAWNIVEIDGEYYNVDVTWDDPVGNFQNSIIYTYFNITDKQINDDHTRDPISQRLPSCTATSANYYVRSGKVFDTIEEFTKAAIIALTNSNANGKFSAKLTNQTAYNELKSLFKGYDWFDVLAKPVANNLGIKPENIVVHYPSNDISLIFEVAFSYYNSNSNDGEDSNNDYQEDREIYTDSYEENVDDEFSYSNEENYTDNIFIEEQDCHKRNCASILPKDFYDYKGINPKEHITNITDFILLNFYYIYESNGKVNYEIIIEDENIFNEVLFLLEGYGDHWFYDIVVPVAEKLGYDPFDCLYNYEYYENRNNSEASSEEYSETNSDDTLESNLETHSENNHKEDKQQFIFNIEVSFN